MTAVKRALAMRRTSKLRSAGVAFFALFLLVLQPVCAAYERHIASPLVAPAATDHGAGHADDASHGSYDDTPCCSEMRADAIASESPAAASKNFLAALAFVALPLAAISRPGSTLRSYAAWSTPPPLPLSYHARSARILR